MPSSTPTNTCRLRKASPDGRPRPLRVTLSNVEDVERLLVLTSVPSGAQETRMRARPDFPWPVREERRARNKNSEDTGYDRKCSMILHGIPESSTGASAQKHDFEQWQYVRRKLSLSVEDCGAWSLQRIPRPAQLRIAAPRLTRVTLLSPEMATTLLERWYTCKHTFPQEVRLHPDRPKRERARTSHRLPDAEPTVIASTPTETELESISAPVSVTSNVSFAPAVTKNVSSPTRVTPESV